MSFFRWIPDDSANMVSPWIAIYFGLTAIITAATFWRWKTWNENYSQGLNDFIAETIDRNDVEKRSVFSDDGRWSRQNRRRDTSDDLEMQTIEGAQRA